MKSADMEASDSGWMKISIPAGVRCHYSVTVTASSMQRVRFADSVGDMVFEAVGKGGEGHSHQISAGSFFSENPPNEFGDSVDYYLSICNFNRKIRQFDPSAILSTTDAVIVGQGSIYQGLDYVASNTESFSDGVSCVVRLFYLPIPAPPSPKFISVFAAVDVEAILARTPNRSLDPANPTLISQTDSIVFCGGGKVLMGETHNERLAFSAAIGDLIQWRSSSFSQKSSQNAILYSIKMAVELSSGYSMEHVGKGIVQNVVTPTPQEMNPVIFQADTTPAYCYYTPITGCGKTIHQMLFYITDIIDGKMTPIGYFSAPLEIVNKEREACQDAPD